MKKRYGAQHWWPAETAFEVIVGAVLTQNTAWGNVERAIRRLKNENLLSVKGMSRVDTRTLARFIRPAGYFNVKARRLKNFMNFLNRRYQSSLKRLFSEPLPRLRRSLLAVNGIGPETADSIILYAAGKPVFVVDAYTRRVFSRMGLISAEDPYAKIQDFFSQRLPRRVNIFNEYHALIVEHAKATCRSKPQCQDCVLSRNCRYANRLIS